MSTVQGGQGNIVTNGLVLNLDAANPRSYLPPYNGTTWFDLSGTNNGTLTNGPIYNSANGGSIVFDGVDDYVALGTFQSLTNSFTVSFYVNPSGGGGSNIFGFYNSSGPFNGWGIRIASNNLNFWDGASWTNPNIVVSNSIWKNVCVVVSSTYLLSFYIDGTFITSLQGATISTYTGNKVLGSRSDGAGPMIGSIANTQIYNRALSSSEISQNFQATRARFGI